MNYLKEIASYLIGMLLMLFALFTVMVPLFDWLPRVIYLSLFKKELSTKAIFVCIKKIILWGALNCLLVLLVFIFIPFINKHSVYDGSFLYGEVSGIFIYLFLIIFIKRIRARLNNRYKLTIWAIRTLKKNKND